MVDLLKYTLSAGADAGASARPSYASPLTLQRAGFLAGPSGTNIAPVSVQTKTIDVGGGRTAQMVHADDVSAMANTFAQREAAIHAAYQSRGGTMERIKRMAKVANATAHDAPLYAMDLTGVVVQSGTFTNAVLSTGGSVKLTYTSPAPFLITDLFPTSDETGGVDGLSMLLITASFVGPTPTQAGNSRLGRYRGTRFTGNRNNFAWGRVSAQVPVTFTILNTDGVNAHLLSLDVEGRRLDMVEHTDEFEDVD